MEQALAKLDVDQGSKVLKLLGDKTRLTMICLLDKSECCVCEFVEMFDVSQPSISQHLRKLKDAGLIQERRNGQWMYYSLVKDNESYPLIQAVLHLLPDLQSKLIELEKNGKRVMCE